MDIYLNAACCNYFICTGTQAAYGTRLRMAQGFKRKTLETEATWWLSAFGGSNPPPCTNPFSFKKRKSLGFTQKEKGFISSFRKFPQAHFRCACACPICSQFQQPLPLPFVQLPVQCAQFPRIPALPSAQCPLHHSQF